MTNEDVDRPLRARQGRHEGRGAALSSIRLSTHVVAVPGLDPGIGRPSRSHATTPAEGEGGRRVRERARSAASAAHFSTWARRLMTCRFGVPQKPRRSGQGRSRCWRETWKSGMRWSTSAPRRSRRPVVPQRRPCRRFKQAGLIARRVPELPGRDTGRVPLPAARAAGARKVAVPAEPEHRLTADAAMSRSLGEALLAIGRRRRPEALVLAPAPALRRAAAAGERAGEAVGAQGWARQ